MNGTRYWTFLAAVSCALAASAAGWYAKPGTTDWTDKSRYYNNDSKPESQKALPAPGDTLYLSGTNGKFYLDASGDKASLALVNTMSYVMPERAEAQLYVTVSGTDEVEFKPGITDRNNSGRLGGLVVKQGTGTLKLVNTVNSAGLSESYLMNFDIQAGVVKFPQGLSNASLRAANVKVAAGAKLYLMTIADNAESTSSSGTTYMNSLSGAGDVIYSYPGATTVRNLCIETDSTFDGVLTGPVVLTLNKPNARVNLTNPNSTFSGEGSGISIIGEGSHIGLESLCKDHDVSVPPTTPTAMGLNSLLRFYAKETGVVYLGNGGETFYAGLNAQ